MSRPPPAADPVRLRFGAFELDEANARLLRGGQPVVLAPTPFRLLCALARQPGALLRKDQLLDTVWGHQFVSESVLKTAISDLRTALGDSPREPRLIETVSRRGYRFIGAAIAGSPAPLPSSAVPSTSEPAPAPTSTSALPPVPAAPFVGRARTLARLHHAWQGAGQGQRQLVWVAGEPGIGKTTLIEHFVAGLGPVAAARGQWPPCMRETPKPRQARALPAGAGGAGRALPPRPGAGAADAPRGADLAAAAAVAQQPR